MDLARAIAASGLAGRTAERRFRSTEAEIREAEQRVAARRTAAAAASVAAASVHRDYPERGRHTAPRPARA